ncbi:MAG TPA: hypothetical protein VGE67_09015 [Haloferula sp.]
MTTSHWKAFGCCAILILAGAVFHKHREVTGLREEARRHALVSGPAEFFGAETKTRRERPQPMSDEGFGEGEDDEFMSGMGAFNHDGNLTEEAIKRLGLTEEEATAANDAMYKFRAEAERDLVQRLKPTTSYSEGGSSRQRYYARARRDRGQTPFDGLTLALGSVIGQDRTKRVMKAFIKNDTSARLCKLDLEVELIQPSKEGEEVKVSYQTRSPRDGDVTSFHGGITVEEFEREVGKLFDGESASEK